MSNYYTPLWALREYLSRQNVNRVPQADRSEDVQNRLPQDEAQPSTLKGEGLMPNNLTEIPPERWRAVQRGGEWTAALICIECGRESSLSRHEIDGVGIVYPDVTCPWNRAKHPELKDRMELDDAPDCDFHANIRLVGWPPVQAQLTQPPGSS